MANKNKAKGSDAERRVTRFLAECGVRSARIPAGSTLDEGDIFVANLGWPAIQVKDHTRLDLAGWVRDVTTQAINANRRNGVVWHKKRGTTNPGEWYVTMTGQTFVELLEGL